MIKNAEIKYTPMKLANKLFEYPNSGKTIYKRNRKSQKPEKRSDTCMTVMQLICANIIHLEVTDTKNPTAICKLSFTDYNPNYVNVSYWNTIRTF